MLNHSFKVMEKLDNIIATYKQIIQTSEVELQKTRKRIYYISLLRLVLFVGAIVGAVIFWSDGWTFLFAFAILPFILFVWLVKRHNLWFYRKDFLKKKILINEQELRAMQHDFSEFDGGDEFIDPTHLYTFDLDVFGEHSLFQYINRTSTPVGRQHLANWFSAHLEDKEAIEQRQQAVRELSSELDYRQQIRLLGLLYKGKWFRSTLCQFELEAEKNGGPKAYDVLNAAAEKLPAGSEGLVVLPYFMGERSPVWDSDAKGTIVGLSLTHTKAHLYRAFLEAVAYSLRNAMEATGENLGEYILLAGGVTKSKVWRQIFADVTGYPVVCPIYDVEANMGDVMLAGIGTGLLTYEEVKKWQVLDEKIQPDPRQHEIYNEYYEMYQSVYQDLKDDMKKITRLAGLRN